ncbi:MAG: hypothetical protein KC593_10095 [Myxococcales bacterium]|nr:hypothetical protein [Myxococcales bacterium]MCB9626900.1 hypothetical protein [Sandaracinaceae bacterium]
MARSTRSVPSSWPLRRLSSLALVGALLAFATFWAAPAAARRTTDLGYRYDQVWTAAVRLVRVDYGFTVTERDQELGFVMFDYIESGRTYGGSIEVLRTADALGRDRVRVVVVIQGQPEYVERMIMDRLERKLRGDYGAPPRAEPQPPAAPTPTPDSASAPEAPADGAAPDA